MKHKDNQNIVPIRLMDIQVEGKFDTYFEPIAKRTMPDGKLYLEIRMQGCLKKCKNCWYPEAKPMYGGDKHYVNEIVEVIDDLKRTGAKIGGVILTGGEPFLQPASVLELIQYTIPRGLKVICYTGYTFEEILEWNDARHRMLELIDILIDGEYDESKLCDERLPWVTTSNQRVIDVKKTLETGKITLYGDDKL